MTFLLQQLAEHLLILGTFDMGEGGFKLGFKDFSLGLTSKVCYLWQQGPSI